MVIILVYQCNNGISRCDGTFVSMLEMGYRDGRESVNKELSVLGVIMSILLFAVTASNVTAQNASSEMLQTLLEMRVRQLMKLLQKLVLTHQTDDEQDR